MYVGYAQYYTSLRNHIINKTITEHDMVSCLKLNVTAINPPTWWIQTNTCHFIILNYPDVLYMNVYESEW